MIGKGRPSEGAERARRLAQLAESLDDARKLLVQYAEVPSVKQEVAELVERVAAASAELDSLRRGEKWPFGGAFSPKRISLSRERADNGA